MNLQPATNDSGVPPWGSFALVTYLPDPLGVFLTQLRHLLPGETRPEAHITFLPPRPLALTPEMACREIGRILASCQPFEVELGNVEIFPKTGILYLSVKSGCEELLRLHDALNRGTFFSREHFEYIPHLTLGGPLAAEEVETSLQQAQLAWARAGLSPRFLVKEMVLLWQPVDCAENDWTRISALPMGSSAAA